MNPADFKTIMDNLDAAGAEMRKCADRPLPAEPRHACTYCHTFYSEPGGVLCVPCAETINEMMEASNG